MKSLALILVLMFSVSGVFGAESSANGKDSTETEKQKTETSTVLKKSGSVVPADTPTNWSKIKKLFM